MKTICATSPLPSFTSLSDAFKELATLPNLADILPDFPTFGKLSLGAIDNPEIFLTHWLQAFQQGALLAVINLVIKPISKILGGDIDDLLPKVPGLEIGFTKFLTITSAELYAAIKTAINNQVQIIINLIPDPIISGFDSPDLNLPEIAKSLLASFVTKIISKLVDLIDKVTKILEVAGMPDLPEIPTQEQLTQMLRAYLAEFGGTINDAIKKLIPILPSPLLPDPLMLSTSSIEFEFRQAIQILMNEFMTLPLKIITDFITKILGVKFPVLCISIPDIANPLDQLA